MFEEWAVMVNQKLEKARQKLGTGHATVYDFIMVPEGEGWKIYRKSQGQERILVFESDDTESAIRYLCQNTPH